MTARVAEYQRLPDGILFRVIHVDKFGIIYVMRLLDGTLRAEKFYGRVLPSVPPDAREAVDRYVRQHMPELVTDLPREEHADDTST